MWSTTEPDSADIEGSRNAARVKGIISTKMSCKNDNNQGTNDSFITLPKSESTRPWSVRLSDQKQCWVSLFPASERSPTFFTVSLLFMDFSTAQQVICKLNFKHFKCANRCMYDPSHTASIRLYGDRLGKAYNRVRLLITERESEVKLTLPRRHSF